MLKRKFTTAVFSLLIEMIHYRTESVDMRLYRLRRVLKGVAGPDNEVDPEKVCFVHSVFFYSVYEACTEAVHIAIVLELGEVLHFNTANADHC